MKFVIMSLVLEVIDYMLPVGGEDVFVCTMKTLINLFRVPRISLATCTNMISGSDPYICPCSCVEIGYWSISLTCKLWVVLVTSKREHSRVIHTAALAPREKS